MRKSCGFRFGRAMGFAQGVRHMNSGPGMFNIFLLYVMGLGIQEVVIMCVM